MHRNLNMKVLGAWVILLGLGSLVLGLIGLQFRLLWFLDEFGPLMAYVLKVGLILLGIWMWGRDRTPAVEDQPTDQDERKAWIGVIMAATIIVGCISFIVVSKIRNVRLERQLERQPPTPAWAAKPVTLWPTVVLTQKARFAHHTGMEAGCACLVRLPTGEIVALTAGHLLGRAGGVSPGFMFGSTEFNKRKLATLDDEIVSWDLFLPDAEKETIKLAGLYGKASQWDANCDEVLLRLKPGQTNLLATPLDLRLTAVTMNEELHLITYTYDFDGKLRQVVHTAHRVPGIFFQCILDAPTELHGCSGAPVIDSHGLLVGIVTGGTLMEVGNPTGFVRAFSGHLATELIPVLKPAVASQGVGALPPLHAVFKIPAEREDQPHRETVNNSI